MPLLMKALSDPRAAFAVSAVSAAASPPDAGAPADASPTGSFVDEGNETWYRIEGHDRQPPFFMVLAGDSGRPLAFGPGWAESSALPSGDSGTTIISGHRDTHFAWLRELQQDDALMLETTHGTREYRVASLQVVDSRQQRIATDSNNPQLVLVTCWPFDAVAPRGPLRYVITLTPL